MSVSLALAAQHAALPMPWMTPDQAQPGATLHFPPERPIYVEGDQARYFYKVVSGVVRTCRFLKDGRRQIDAFHQAGDVFGFEPGSIHRLTAEAVSDCQVLAYRRRGIETKIALDDQIARHFFNHAMTCLEQTREHCLLLGRASAAQKIGAFLMEMAERGGTETIVELPMSRQDIADYLGLTIETVSRTLSQMERDKIISLPTTRRILLKDRDTLRELNA